MPILTIYQSEKESYKRYTIVYNSYLERYVILYNNKPITKHKTLNEAKQLIDATKSRYHDSTS